MLVIGLSFFIQVMHAQDYRWQQRVEYTMDVHLDVKTHKIKGTQKIVYHNNSNDTLNKVYYHLYLNAFQPGSMMDVRSRNLPDPDKRVTDRISKLKENEIGYQHILSMKQDGIDTNHEINETILTVALPHPVLPHSATKFDIEFEAQIPLQIRRTGRNSLEGVDYSVTQWYPKLAEYDFRGWHIYPYIAREFHGVWGDYDVTISLDHKYMVAGTGHLENANEIGYGYESTEKIFKQKKQNTSWHFIAMNVHDFAWAADPDYKHDIAKVPDGPTVHFFYQPGQKTNENWKKLQDYTVLHFQYMNKTYGKYPYENYSIIQGGDGGMEYPMCTLMLGEKTLGSLVGTMVHEVSHSWFQGVLASNEMLYHWMDEGFSDFVSQESMANLFKTEEPSHKKSYASYFTLIKRGLQEPSSQEADFFSTNRAYAVGSYAMGTIFLEQLKYIVGEENFYEGMRRYYEAWKFRHPEPNDFIRIMEKTSGLQLRWYYKYWIHSTKHIDYGIDKIVEQGDKSVVTLKRIGELPMPVEVLITLTDGKQEHYYIPLNETFGSKPKDRTQSERIDLPYWSWVNPNYEINLGHVKSTISKIEIDPNSQTADINQNNNLLILSQ
jgi:hypothetical protein